MNWKKILCLFLVGLFLLSYMGCQLSAGNTESTEPTEAPVASAEEFASIIPSETKMTESEETYAPNTLIPTSKTTEVPTFAPTPTLTPTPTPTSTPEPTRIPRDGDISINFPDYDTGSDADYSYQSDELRIAIKVVSDEKKHVYYIADIWIQNIYSFRTQFGNSKYNSGPEEGEKLATRENAIFAVNGSYNLGLTLHAGVRYKNLRSNKGWNSGSVCIIYKDGSMKTFQLGQEKFDLDKEIENGAWHGWQFGPIIIRDYEKGPNIGSYGNLGYRARNMLGYYEPGHYVIVTCDADTNTNTPLGMTADDMFELMKSLGVKDAFNLDGGNSAVMIFMGREVNNPGSAKNMSGRKLKDMLLFGEYDENGDSADLSSFTADKNKGK